MKGKKWTLFKLVSMLLVLASLYSAFNVVNVSEIRFWVCLGITACVSAAYLVLFIESEKNLHKFVTEMKSQINLTERDSLYKFPAPAVIIDSEGKIIWYNIAFNEHIYAHDAFGMDVERLVNIDIHKAIEAHGQSVDYISGDYRISAVTTTKENSDLTLIYFENIRSYLDLKRQIEAKRPVVLVIMVDNYDDLFNDIKESEKAHINIHIDKIMETFSEECGGIVRKTSNDKFVAVIEQQYLEKLCTERFKILDKAREIAVGDRMTVTLSIGVGRGADSITESEKLAKQALDMSLGRGGDQVAIKSTDGTFEFFGGVSKGVEKQTKVKTRIISTALYELIEQSEKVYIMGHRFGDLDSLGAGAGLVGAIKMMDKYVRFVVDRQKCLAVPIIERLEENIEDEIFITPAQACEEITDKSLLIIVDTQNKDILESTELYEKAKQVVVIDHHRKVVNYVDNAVIFHHEPYASSASEMVAELIQYFSGIEKLSSYYADAMLSGIALDTKNFIMRTGVRTFEAAAFLRKLGADTVAVKKLFSNSAEVYKKRAELIANSEIYKGCAIAVTSDECRDIRIIAAQAADEMLSIQGVSASFTIYMQGGAANYSARSYGALNVQIIMEKLGGGGHQTMAGAMIKDVTPEEARAKLVAAVDEYLDSICAS